MGLPRAAAVPAILAVLLFAPAVSAQTTSWTGSVGDWSVGTNWSGGEPTAGTDAVIPLTGTPTITAAGEVCKSLAIGTQSGGATVRVNSGSLAVGGLLQVGAAFTATFQQFGGTVSAVSLLVGGTSPSGAYVMNGGSVTLGSAQIGLDDGSSGGTFSTAISANATINGSLHIGPTGSVVVGSGMFKVGTQASDGIVVKGAFQVVNQPAITAPTLTMTEDGRLHFAVGPGVPTTVVISGAATLDGQLLITDVLAPDGTYEVLRANPLQGTFDMATVMQGWSWHISGNSLYLVKGDVAVEPETWSGVKSRFDR